MVKKTQRVLGEVVISLLVIGAAVFWFRSQEETIWPDARVEAESGYRDVMGTIARIVAVGMDEAVAAECIEAGFSELVGVDELMSDYKEDSEISRVNRDAGREAVEVGEAVFEVLERSVEFSEKTGGVFDITVGPLVDLWRAAGEGGRMPTEEDIAEAEAKVGYDKLKLDAAKRTVRFAVDGMRLDLGGIAKGYAIDKAVVAMREKGAIGGMVDVGGDIRCFGAPPRGRGEWMVGLQNPSISKADTSGQLVLTLKLADKAVATSGDYRRFVLIDGKRFSHIVNPVAISAAGELVSVTIIAASALEADALATAVSVLGSEKGLELVEKSEGVEAILIPVGDEGKIIKSSGAELYIK